MLSIMLSTLLSIRDPLNVTGWTCAKRFGDHFFDVSVQHGLTVTPRNTLKRRDGHFAKVDVEGSNPFSRSKKMKGDDSDRTTSRTTLVPLLVPLEDAWEPYRDVVTIDALRSMVDAGTVACARLGDRYLVSLGSVADRFLRALVSQRRRGPRRG